jgi:hypothetical protein
LCVVCCVVCMCVCVHTGCCRWRRRLLPVLVCCQRSRASRVEGCPAVWCCLCESHSHSQPQEHRCIHHTLSVRFTCRHAAHGARAHASLQTVCMVALHKVCRCCMRVSQVGSPGCVGGGATKGLRGSAPHACWCGGGRLGHQLLAAVGRAAAAWEGGCEFISLISTQAAGSRGGGMNP